jgi:bacteriocin-like protein
MTQLNRHRAEKQTTIQNATDAAQGVNHSAFEALNEETLDQITGGQATPKNTTGWKPIYPGMTISPDGKYITYHGSVLPNSIVHAD